MVDTLYLVKLSDTVTMACCKACQCQNLIEKETNPYDANIAKTICGTILQLVIIVAAAILLYHIIKGIFDIIHRNTETKKVLKKEALEYIKEKVKAGENVVGDSYIAKIDQYTK